MELFSYQKEAVGKMLSFLVNGEANAVYNAAEQGTGKSVMACGVLNKLPVSAVLLICPAVMRLTWEKEINTWVTAKKLTPIVLLKKQELTKAVNNYINRINKPPVVFIVSYDLATSGASELAYIPFDLLLLDEAHYLKSSKAKRTKAILKDLWPRIKYRVCLSGTPFTASVMDGWTVFKRMAPSVFKDYHAFANRYSYMRLTPWGPKYYGVRNHEELRDTIRKRFFVRYLKEEVLKDLPPKTWSEIILPESYSLEYTAEQARTAEGVAKALQTGESISIPASLAAHRRMQGELKAPAVVEFTKDLLDQEIPVVLFGWHKSVIEKYREALSAYKPVFVTGETPNRARQEAIEQFQGGDSNLFIGNIAAAGVGITLTRSSTVVFGELDWSPATVAQASDRVHRVSQTKNVTCYTFTVKNSLDETIEKIIFSKLQAFNKILK